MQNGVQSHIDWLAPKQAAAFLNVSIWTLRAWRKPRKERGPPFYRREGRILYARADIEEWLGKIRTVP